MVEASAFRLPTSVRPLKYDVTLTPDLDRFTFEGEERIELEVVTPSPQIKLNAVDLDVRDAKLATSDGAMMAATNIFLEEGAETVTFTFERDVQAGPAALSITFSGT